MKLIAFMSIIGMVGTAYADPCADPPKKTPPKRPHVPKRPPPKPPEAKPCDCKGVEGPRGPKGDKGEAGRVEVLINHTNDVIVHEVRARPALRLGLGLMGTAQAPHGDWAWGPALQLSTDLDEHYELALSAGLAMGASDGRESGYMLELKVTRPFSGKLGLFGGVHYADIDGSQDNGNIDGNYLGATAGLSYTGNRVRLAAGPTLGGLRDDFETGTQLALGVQGSVFVRFGK